MTFREYFILSEKTFPSELYHATGIYKLKQIIDSGVMKLTFANLEGPDKEINDGKMFYLSMSYEKWGRYARGYGEIKLSEEPYIGMNVIMVMDATKLQPRGKLVDADYWGDMTRGYTDNEQEVRFVSDKQTIPVKDSVKEVHIFIPQEKRRSGGFKMSEKDVRTLLYIEENGKRNFDVYFYKNPSAFKTTTKRMSVPLSEALPRSGVERPETKKHGSYRQREFPELSALIKLLLGDVDRLDDGKERRQAENIINWARYHPHDFKPQLSADFHNARSKHPQQLQDIVTIMRKLKLNDFESMRRYLDGKYPSGIK